MGTRMAVEFSHTATFLYPTLEENACRLKTPHRFPRLALLWSNNLKSMALPADLGIWVDCFMTQGYLTGKRLRTPGLPELAISNQHW